MKVDSTDFCKQHNSECYQGNLKHLLALVSKLNYRDLSLFYLHNVLSGFATLHQTFSFLVGWLPISEKLRKIAYKFGDTYNLYSVKGRKGKSE
jgi:hypothetical protein